MSNDADLQKTWRAVVQLREQSLQKMSNQLVIRQHNKKLHLTILDNLKQ